jgi:Phytanoyl-CoA dioxygenase (PhyH)
MKATPMQDTGSGLAATATTADFAARGVAMFEYVLTDADLAAMDAAFPVLPDRTAGARGEAFQPAFRDWLAGHTGLIELAGRLLGAPARLSRMQVFNKSGAANWFVPWHQDRAEDGQDRPVAALERTVALRIHLDDCDENCGPLEVVPGSHVHGRLEAGAISDHVAAASPLLCLAVRGDILAMRPLLIHRSQRAKVPAARRVIHVEFSSTAARYS